MAGSLNKVTLIGNVGRDPEVRTMNGGDMVANFSIATSESWGKGEERQERTEWHKVVVWGKLAEIIEKYVLKGTKIYVEGQLQTRSWEKEGVKQYSTEVVLRGFDAKLILLSSKDDTGAGRADAGSGGGRSATRQTSTSAPTAGRREAPSNSFDDDIPF